MAVGVPNWCRGCLGTKRNPDMHTNALYSHMHAHGAHVAPGGTLVLAAHRAPGSRALSSIHTKMNPGPIDHDAVLKIDDQGQVATRAEEDRSEAESWHHHFIVSTALVVCCAA